MLPLSGSKQVFHAILVLPQYANHFIRNMFHLKQFKAVKLSDCLLFSTRLNVVLVLKIFLQCLFIHYITQLRSFSGNSGLIIELFDITVKSGIFQKYYRRYVFFYNTEIL